MLSSRLVGRAQPRALLEAAATTASAKGSAAGLHDRSSVPRVVDDREKRTHRSHDAGYWFRYHRKGIDPLPRIPEEYCNTSAQLGCHSKMLSSRLVGRAQPRALLEAAATTASAKGSAAGLHDRSSVPRVVDDREKRTHRSHDAGYWFRYHRKGIDPLPRIPDCKTPVARPDYKVRDAWSESQARFGQNDYIDLLGDGSLHPALLQYHTPRWLRGFPGQHRANELIKLIHYRNLYKEKMQNTSPRRWHELRKRIKYLLMHHNYNKQDELSRERDLGLWEPEADYAYKDKSRRSFKDEA